MIFAENDATIVVHTRNDFLSVRNKDNTYVKLTSEQAIELIAELSTKLSEFHLGGATASTLTMHIEGGTVRVKDMD